MSLVKEELHSKGNIPTRRESFLTSILKKIPRRFRYKTIKQLIKFNIIKRYGKFLVKVYDKNGKLRDYTFGYNLVPDVGIQHLGDILVGVESTNITLDFIEAGSGTTTPVIGDTDTETPLTPADRLAATAQTRSGSTPYEITIQTFINSTKYNRPASINEMCVFFGPDVSGDLFARGLLDSTITLNASETATIAYSLVFR